jgi:hypothetical protein
MTFTGNGISLSDSAFLSVSGEDLKGEHLHWYDSFMHQFLGRNRQIRKRDAPTSVNT